MAEVEVAAHLYRSPLLGVARTVKVQAGEIRYFERGDGPVIVFTHGWLANANLWRKVVARLSEAHRCIVLDLPLGAHGTPVDPGADLSPPGCGALIMDVIEALGLSDVTLVGNDSGGAYSQIGVAASGGVVGRVPEIGATGPAQPRAQVTARSVRSAGQTSNRGQDFRFLCAAGDRGRRDTA